MLNDAARPLRWMTFALCAPLGLMLGPVVALARQGGSPEEGVLVVGPALLLSAPPLFALAALVSTVLLTRADRRLRERARRPWSDHSHLARYGVRAAGRVVRARRDRGGGSAVVCTALTPGGARRVVAMTTYAGLRAHRPVALLLDPDDPDVAVLDDRVRPEDLAAIDADPRWRTWTMPTERRVAGGWSLLVVAALVGVLVGAGVSLAVVALVT